MSFIGDLFTGGKKEDTTPKTISTLSSEQQKIMAALGEYLNSQTGKGATPYTGELTAPLSEGEQAAYSKSLANLSAGPTSSAAAGIEAFKKALTGLSPDEVAKQYMTYTAPAEQRYLKDVTIPTFKESMVPGGTLRSTGTERGIGDIVSKFGEGQLSRIGERINAERANAINAIGQTTGINALESGSAAMNEAATYGGIARTVQTAEDVAKLQEFIRTTPEASALIDKMLGYLGISTMAAYQPSSGQSSPFLSLLSSVAPGLGAYLGTAATTAGTAAAGTAAAAGTGSLLSELTASGLAGALGVFSDIRLKDDIQKIGQTAKGINLYVWRWKEAAKKLVGNTSPIGVIAQEVMKIIPSAVHIDKSGYLMVDYSQVI